MGISPWYVGQTGESLTLHCKTDSGVPLPLLDGQGSPFDVSALTLLIKSANGGEIAGGGLLQIVDAANGIVRYQPAGSDVAIPGDYEIALRIIDSNGPVYSDRVVWEIQER